MKTLRLLAIAVLCFVASFVPAQAAQFPPKPAANSFISDTANLVDAPEQQAINQLVAALLKDQQVPVYVVTIEALSAWQASGLGIENYARELFNSWGIGQQNRNFGVLLLVSLGDRTARIQLGAGYADEYSARVNDIMEALIIPSFKQSHYSVGILDGVRGIDAMVRGLNLPAPTVPKWFWLVLAGGVVGFIAMVVSLFRSGRSGWAWALIGVVGTLLVAMAVMSRRSGGSGGGFGGGSSGGGGATGRW